MVTDDDSTDNPTPKVLGFWSYGLDVEPDENGNLSPEDLWFFAPGDPPPSDEDWHCGGTWTFFSPEDEEESDEKIFRKVEDTKGDSSFVKGKTLGSKRTRVSLPRKYPCKAYVYPPSQAPEQNVLGAPQGCWTREPSSGKHNGGGEWYPQELILYELGKEAPEASDKKVPSGQWGYYPGSEPDDEFGHYMAKNMWFCPPGETPPCEPQGTWTCPHGANKQEFVQYRFEGVKMIYTKRTEIEFMGVTTAFTTEWED